MSAKVADKRTGKETTGKYAIIVWTVTGCEDFGQFPTPTPRSEKVVTPTVVTTSDRAILAVYEHLLSQAQSAKAKGYLAEFYIACDNWSAESELFKDGSSIWPSTAKQWLDLGTH